MTPDRLDEIRASNSWTVNRGPLLVQRLDLLKEVDRLRDAYELLAACVGRLDFDRSESALPETQEQWIEFVRAIDERAQALIEAEETSR